MHNPRGLFGLVCLLAAISGAASWAHAQPWTRVEVWNHGVPPCNGQRSFFQEYEGTTPVTINLASCAERVYIYAWPLGSQTDMPRITLTGGPASIPVKISLGFAFNQQDGTPTPVGLHWGGLDASGVALSQFYGGINGNLTGSIKTKQLFRFDAGGEISAAVNPTAPGSSDVCVVEAGSISTTGSILLDSGSLSRVRVYGDMLGPITVTSGSITNRIVINGNLGDGSGAANNGVIRTLNGRIERLEVTGNIRGPNSAPVRVQANQGLGLVKAASILGPVSANANFGTGKFKRLETTGGPLSGTVACFAVESDQPDGGIYVNGDLTSEFGIRAGGLREPFVVTGSITSTGKIDITAGGTILDDATHDGRITVGGSMVGEIRIDGSAGLQGQIVINANNTPGTWTGPVKIGPTGSQIILDDGSAQPYQAPFYAALSSTLGGGAVGLVPYGLHKEDCSPPHAPDGGCGLQYSMRTWPASLGGGDRQTIVLRHYGPVTNPPPSLSPCLLERLAITCPYPIACPGPWEEVPAYHVYLPPENPREVWVALQLSGGQPVKFNPNYTYRVSLIADNGVTRLRSNGTLAQTAPGIVGYPYEFKPLCADVNLDSLINPGDIDAWMERPADVDYSGEIDLADLVRLIEVVGM